MANRKNPTTEFSKKTWLGRDVFLNVGPKEALLRLILGLMIGGFVFFSHNMAIMIAATIICVYLVATSFMLFCYVKYFWRHKILHKKDPLVKDPEVPVHKL
jgi:hypothetical protein